MPLVECDGVETELGSTRRLLNSDGLTSWAECCALTLNSALTLCFVGMRFDVSGGPRG